jgi:hypothetical protein
LPLSLLGLMSLPFVSFVSLLFLVHPFFFFSSIRHVPLSFCFHPLHFLVPSSNSSLCMP